MKIFYIKDFIKNQYWVALDFDSLISNEKIEESSLSVSKILITIIMTLIAFVCLVKLWWVAFTFCLLTALFALLSNWLQSKMGVVFPRKFIWMTILTFFMASAISMYVDKHCDDVKLAKAAILAEQKRLAEIAEKKEQERIAQEKEKKRQDSLSYYLNEANVSLNGGRFMDAVQNYKMALNFADFETKASISYKVGNLLFAKKQYKDALEYYRNVSKKPFMLDTLHYNKATCYVKIGDLASAVQALRFSMRSSRVENLFNKINPIKTRTKYVDIPVQKKRIAHYTTLCRDGSTWGSRSHRGACSRHGGVSNWNHPVYETYTENQKKKVVEKYREYGEL